MATSVVLILFCIILITISKSDYNTHTKNIIVFHARKAGGSIVLRWLNQFRDEYFRINNNNNNINIIHLEAYPFIHGNNNFINNAINKYKDNGLFVFIFRDPIKRIISQYDFEWKWGCIDCDFRDDLTQFNLTSINYMNHRRFYNKDSNKYKYSNIDLNDFLDRIYKFELNNNKFDIHHHIKHHLPYSIYLNNYYLWMFCCDNMYCNFNKSLIGIDNKTKCLKHAQNIINNEIHLILINEWLNDINIQIYVNQVINKYVSSSMRFIAIPEANNHPLIYNRMISRECQQRLMRWNNWDYKLYEFVKHVSYKRSA